MSKFKCTLKNEAGGFLDQADFKQASLRMMGMLTLLEKTDDPLFNRCHKAYEKEFEVDMEIDKESKDRVRFLFGLVHFDLTRSEIYDSSKSLNTTLKRLKGV